MTKLLPFEQPVEQLRTKIEELKRATEDADIDMSAEVQRLEDKLHEVETAVYTNISAWNRVQIARHPERPTTLFYIEALCDDVITIPASHFK